VQEFNKEVSASSGYDYKRMVEKTPVIFFDDNRIIAPELKISTHDWCPLSLVSFLVKNDDAVSVTKLEKIEEAKLVDDESFIEKCCNEIMKFQVHIQKKR